MSDQEKVGELQNTPENEAVLENVDLDAVPGTSENPGGSSGGSGSVDEGTPTKADYGSIFDGIRLRAEFLEYVKHCAAPRHLRVAKTDKAFAAKWNVSVDALSDWKKKEIFQDAVNAEIRADEVEDKADVYGILRQMAKDGDMKAIALLVKIWTSDERQNSSQ